MHPAFQERAAELGALLQKTHAARSEFARIIGITKPEKPVRFQVVTKGQGAYQIVDLITGKTQAFRFDHATAVDFAIQLENKASRQLAAQS